MRNMIKTYDKDSSLISKGLLAIFLLIHHLFGNDAYTVYNIDSLFMKPISAEMVSYFKVCISGFCFISAYGMTRQFSNQKDEAKLLLGRLIKLLFSYWFVYIIAIILKILLEGDTALYVYYNRAHKFDPLFMLFDFFGISIWFGTSTINVTWWYMSLAILEILTMPILWRLYKTFAYWLIVPSAFLSLLLLNDGANYASLLSSMVLGIFFAQENIFEIIKCVTVKNQILTKIVKGFVCIILVWISVCILRSSADSDAFQSGRCAEHNGRPETPIIVS